MKEMIARVGDVITSLGIGSVCLTGEELIRCKDCKYCEYPNAEREWCKKGHLHGNAENWFCADGKRKEVE